MAYLTNPRWAAVSLQVLRSVQYALVFVAGIVTVFAPPPTLQFQFAQPIITTASVIMTIAAVPAMYGVIRMLYRWEWMAVWFIGSGIGSYAAAAWSRVPEDPYRTLAAANLTIAFLFFLMRAINLTVIAQKARTERRLTVR